ncbi:GL15470 [Drosophila persimilis]|uniref:GL15470 n=1 Tax=Drosophila persimilis TaxID=7234 RepID=B4H6P8_DROPE|nr:GL15470 [Drosophila persimilis]
MFDLICASLFAGLCLDTIFEHRNPRCLRAWILFSEGGILLEMCLLLYAFFSQSTFQAGLVRNGLFLMSGLIVELVFLYTIYQFYKALARCKRCKRPLESNSKSR